MATQNRDNLPKGVIFDMDGVLLDSEEFISSAAIAMFAEHGLHVQPEDFRPFIGAGENRFIGGVAEKYDFPFDIERDKKRTYDIYTEIIKGRLNSLPGVKEFITNCKDSGKRIAIASSADMRKVRANLQEIGISFDTFDSVVVGEDVEHKKPSPDIFLLAAERIGLNPSECLVVEDAVNGVQAAKAAGALCLAITTSFTAEQLHEADWLAPNLAHVSNDAMKW